MDIQLVNGRWLVNGKEFKNLTYDERKILGTFIESFKHHEKTNNNEK